MRRKLLPLILGGLLSIAAVAPTSAATCTVDRGGAAGLVAAVVQANVCDVYVLNNSLNNLLRNADIDVLNNILNNSPFLNDVEILEGGIQVLEGGVINVTLLGGTVLTFAPA